MESAAPGPALTMHADSEAQPAFPQAARPANPAQPIKQELSQRVEDFRRRRARLRGDTPADANLEFDFQGSPDKGPVLESRTDTYVGGDTGLDVTLGESDRPETAGSAVDSLILDRPTELGNLELTHRKANESGLEPENVPSRRVEIVLDSHPAGEETEALASTPSLALPPLGRRFLGGLADALVLVVAAALFALIFWRAGGHVSPRPFNLAVFALIGIVLILAYFGIFTALTATTPGLLWVGIEVRSHDGRPPTTQQAFWRAFGYLVSICALMLGFVWALVDSEGLTWHDRMSDTFLTDAEGTEESRELTVHS